MPFVYVYGDGGVPAGVGVPGVGVPGVPVGVPGVCVGGGGGGIGTVEMSKSEHLS